MLSKKLPCAILITTVLLSSCLTIPGSPSADEKTGDEYAAEPDPVESSEAGNAEGEVLELISSESELPLLQAPYKEPELLVKRKADVPEPPRRKVVPQLKPKIVQAETNEDEDVVDANDADTVTADTHDEAAGEPAEEVPAPVQAAEPAAAVQQPEPEPVAGKKPEPEPVIESRVSAVTGEVFNVVLEGEGWLLEKMQNIDGVETADIRFNGREYRAGQTIFFFYPFAAETFSLSFRLVDYSAGTSKEEVVLASVYSDPEKAASQTVAAEADEQETAEAGGDSEAAVTGSGAAGAVESEPQAVPVPVIPDDAEGLVRYAEALAADGDCVEAVELLEKRLEAVSWTERDRLYFALAELYQNCDGVRDERQAVDYYQQIVDYYPVSNYWTISKERINYLERYFIYIK